MYFHSEYIINVSAEGETRFKKKKKKKKKERKNGVRRCDWHIHISWRTVQRRGRSWYTKIYVKAYHVDMKKEITHTRWSMEVVTLRNDELLCHTQAIYYITWQKLYLKNKLMCCSSAVLLWHVLQGITTYQLLCRLALVVRDATKPTNQPQLTEGRRLARKRKSMSLSLFSHSCVQRIVGRNNRHLKL
jgi:hypothetical protein